MTEILFTLTTIFVAYVIYSIVNDPKAPPSPVKPETPIPAVTESEQPAIVQQEARPIVVAPKESAILKTVMVKPVAPKGSVKDPNTGDIATVTNNYRFTKRWIKEALVTEGLLSKIYKNNELDANTEGDIKTALMALAEMDKYRV
jgi:hypothetical protein